MDRTNDVLSAEAAVLHAALERDADEVEQRLRGFLDGELNSLWGAVMNLRDAIAVESSRRLSERYNAKKAPR